MSLMGHSRRRGASCRSGHVRNAPLATVGPKKAACREWDGPAALPPPTALRVPRGLVRRRSAVMPRTSSVHAVTTIGMDMGKNTLHMIGLDSRGAIVLREKVSTHRIEACEPAMLSHWHRSRFGDTLCCS